MLKAIFWLLMFSIFCIFVAPYIAAFFLVDALGVYL